MRMLKVSILLAIGASLLLPASALIAQDDNEVIEEANKRNISMVFTSMRHFRH